MHKALFLTIIIPLVFGFPCPILAASQELAEATELLGKMHADECQKQKIRGQLLLAHQSHDQARMTALAPQLDAINDRLKPSEMRLKALKEGIRKNPEDQGAFDTAQLALGECD